MSRLELPQLHGRSVCFIFSGYICSLKLSSGLQLWRTIHMGKAVGGSLFMTVLVTITILFTMFLACMTIAHDRFAFKVLVARNVNSRIFREEIHWTQRDLMNLHGPIYLSFKIKVKAAKDSHYWPILHSWIMCKTEHRPDDDIIIFNIVTSLYHVLYTTSLFVRLERIWTCRP